MSTEQTEEPEVDDSTEWHPDPQPETPEAMTMLERRQRKEYAENIASGKGSFRVPTKLAAILGAGNDSGFSDYNKGLPSRPQSDDFIFVRGYDSGYKMASKGRLPQREQLRRMGLHRLVL